MDVKCTAAVLLKGQRLVKFSFVSIDVDGNEVVPAEVLNLYLPSGTADVGKKYDMTTQLVDIP